jgi:hypothetical protein
MKKQKIISFIVYLIATVIFGPSSFALLMNGTWHVPADSIAGWSIFLAPMILFLGAFVCLFNLSVGRIICAAALIAFGTFYTYGITSAHNPDLIFFSIYFGALAFAFFYPARWKFSFLIFGAILLMAVVFETITFLKK